MAGHNIITKLMTLLCPPLGQRASLHTARASHLELIHKVKKTSHHSFEPSLHIEPPHRAPLDRCTAALLLQAWVALHIWPSLLLKQEGPCLLAFLISA